MFLYCSLLRSSEGFFHEASRIFAEKGLLREGIVKPVGAGEVRMRGGDACVALSLQPGRRKRPHPVQPDPRPYGNEAASRDYQYIFGWLMMV